VIAMQVNPNITVRIGVPAAHLPTRKAAMKTTTAPVDSATGLPLPEPATVANPNESPVRGGFLHTLRFAAASLVLLGALLSAGTARADSSPCVTTVAQLAAAINSFDSQPDGSTLKIRIKQGLYDLGALPNWRHLSLAQGLTFQMLGGYDTSACTTRTIDPTNTVISGSSQALSGLDFELTGHSTAFIEGLSFMDMHAGADGDTAALRLGLIYPEDDAVFQVRYCQFTHNVGNAILEFEGAEMLVDSSVIADNTLLNDGLPGALRAQPEDVNAYLIAMNNTIANNQGGSGLLLDGGNAGESNQISDITDNIFWGNATDIRFSNVNSTTFPLMHEFNIVGTYSGGFQPTPSDQAINPLFNAPGDYTLASNSPAINTGNPFQFYGFPAHDVAGNPRVVGSRVDMGGYESPYDDRGAAFVTTSADNGNDTNPIAGSLRAAIKTANSAGGPFQVKFAIPGGCAQNLELAAPMPPIVGDVTIDGTTQPGWVANASTTGFDANLCIFINGSNSSVSSAFIAPISTQISSERLTVSGLIFAGFSDAAIRLEGGGHHRIVGNQFSPLLFTLPNHQAIAVTSGSGATQIGDSDPAFRNLIGGSTDVGIVLDNASGGSIVENNLIGIQASGDGNFGNRVGVEIIDSPDNLVSGNAIGWSTNAGVQITGFSASGNKIQDNRIGLGGDGTPAANGGPGVQVDSGAAGNRIGGPLVGSYGGNVIAYSGGAGAWLTSTAGDGNSVLTNIFFANSGLDIDLADIGPTANEPPNPAALPNERQNYPELSQASYLSANGGREIVSGSLQGAPLRNYRIDVYLGTACGPGSRGLAEFLLGSKTITTGTVGTIDFSLDFIPPSRPPLGKISATATDFGDAQGNGAGDTSEIGNCVTETDGDVIFKDGFD